MGNYWRALYKLEKGFVDMPSALNIATNVKAEVDAFKEHIPIVQVGTSPAPSATLPLCAVTCTSEYEYKVSI